jgi:hypothetical protein
VRVPVTVAGGGGGTVRVRVRLGLAPAADPGVEAPALAFTLSREAPAFREVVRWESQRVVWEEEAQ